MSKKIFEIANKYAQVMKEEGVNLKAVYLFGSRVKGMAKRWSDLDIGVVTDDFGDDRIAGMAKLFYLGSKVSYLIEPHLMTTKDFDDKYDSLAQEIKRTGVRVV